MRKAFALALVCLLTLSLLTACGGNTDTTPTEGAEPGYKITAYYNENGTFSALGLALDEVNGEKTLTVKSGDILTVGGNQYSVTAETLTLPFYTQSSLDEGIKWWTDYCESRIERGELAEEK